MRKVFTLTFFVFLFATPAFAQNVRVDNVTFSSVQGFPFLPGATITICTAAATGLPCSPTVAGTCLSISDTTCNQSATQTSDALGNYGFWIQPGSYSYTVTKAGFGGFGPKALTLACQPTATCTMTAPQTINSNLTVSGTATLNGATSTVTNLNSTVICDGTKYATIQAAAATLPATGGEVFVPSGSTCTWNGAGFTGNITVRFKSAAATYVVTAPIIMTGGGNHLICEAGESIGLSAQNNTGFLNVGTVLNFTGNLTGTQDAISATSANGSATTTNDNNTVEGCYIKMGGSGRAAIHWSGINGTLVRFNVIADPGSYGYWVDGGSTVGSHAYGNRVESMDVLHSGLEAYRLSTDPAGTGVGGDIDRTTFVNVEQHPCDVLGTCNTAAELGQGIHLLIPSTGATTIGISNTLFQNFISNGTANGTYGAKLEVGRTGTQGISGFTFIDGELEDVINTSNTGIAFNVTDTAMTDVTHITVVGGGLIGPGYNTGTNFIGLNKVNGTYYQNGLPSSNTNAPNTFDVISFLNNFSATPSCTSATTASPGIRFGIAQPDWSLLKTNDGLLHYYNCVTATDGFQLDGGNTQLKPAVDNTWKLGNHNVAFWNEVATYNLYTRTQQTYAETVAPTASASNDICYGDSTLHALKCSYNNGSFFQIPQVITATSAAFATATTAGTCVQNTTAVAGAATTMAASASPVSTPGVGAVWSAFVSSAGNVTINECAVATSAGGTIAFNIRVTP